jgi:hypothetical protein
MIARVFSEAGLSASAAIRVCGLEERERKAGFLVE